MDTLCTNCGVRIVKVRFALGDCWMHDPDGQGRSRDMNRFCHTMTATPPADTAMGMGSNTGIYSYE